MEERNATLKDGFLTAMDALVLVLIIDVGFTPTAIVGACYVMLRLLNKDSARFVDGLPGLINRTSRKLEDLFKRMKAKKSAESSETETE